MSFNKYDMIIHPSSIRTPKQLGSARDKGEAAQEEDTAAAAAAAAANSSRSVKTPQKADSEKVPHVKVDIVNWVCTPCPLSIL